MCCQVSGSAAMEQVGMAMESLDSQGPSQQLPQLPEFNDPPWFLESTIQDGELELISSSADGIATPFLGYVVSC